MNKTGCIICNKPLIYAISKERKCSLCGKNIISSCECEDGHFVCDECHSSEMIKHVLSYLTQCNMTDPIEIFEEIASFEEVHMHGPEHHMIVPAVLLTAYNNCTGKLNIKGAILTAFERGKKVPGGTCGYFGACGAAIGAGIYMSILTGSSPMHAAAWPVSQKLTGRCLDKLSESAGPRCCKRTCREVIEQSAEFTSEYFGIEMKCSNVKCNYSELNNECLKIACRYY